MPALAHWQWILGAVCALFVGVAKSGVPGFAIFVVLAGMAVGTVALGWGEPTIRRIIGAVVLTMIVAHIVRKRRGPQPVPTSWSHSALYGVVAGFATTVANAAGPVMNVYLLSKRLEKEEFVAAGAWFFFLINLLKLPIYLWRGMITRSSLLFDLCLLPVVLVGSLVGRALVRRLRQGTFEVAVLTLALAATVLLFIPR
jgi:uncharacterized membrane protein YfcA